MKVGIYAVRDLKADAYMQLMSFATDGVAAREFSNAVRNQDSFLAKHPEDYTLYKLGMVDETTGDIEKLVSPLPVVTALSIVA